MSFEDWKIELAQFCSFACATPLENVTINELEALDHFNKGMTPQESFYESMLKPIDEFLNDKHE